MTDIHALIQEFLQQQTITPLVKTGEEGQYNKAGVVPFLRSKGGLSFYVMKPVPKLASLGEPPFQLCKGTRQYFTGMVWKDMRDEMVAGKHESLAATALREGVEELGLQTQHIKALFDLGPYGFSSATTGKGKQMWLYAAEMSGADVFLHDREVAEATSARKWLTLAEFAVVGRDDHLYILRDIEEKLKSRQE